MSTALRLYEQQTLLNKSGESSTGFEEFNVISGSKLIVTLLVKAISGGATLRLDVENGFDNDEAFENVATILKTSTGMQKEVVINFNSFFRLRYTVTGGTATFKTSVILHTNDADSSIGGFAPPEGTDAITRTAVSSVIDDYKYRMGGVSGTVLMTVRVTYTTSTKAEINSAVKI